MIKLNSDIALVALIKQELERNGSYCPCRLEKSEDTKCMCKEFREVEVGMCHCGLFIKE